MTDLVAVVTTLSRGDEVYVAHSYTNRDHKPKVTLVAGTVTAVFHNWTNNEEPYSAEVKTTHFGTVFCDLSDVVKVETVR